MLLQIRDYIQHEKYVSVEQLMRVFHVDFLALEPMLEKLERYGIKVPKKLNCSHGCKRC